MRPIKDIGLKEVRSARSRARKLWSMERIARPDFEFIDRRLDEVESRIVSMSEIDEYGHEVYD